MKNVFKAVVLAALLSSGAWAALQKIDVTVNGMVCSFCAQGITKKFSALPEIEKVTVKLGDQKVYLTAKEGKTISDETIKKLLKESGYSVETIERTPQ